MNRRLTRVLSMGLTLGATTHFVGDCGIVRDCHWTQQAAVTIHESVTSCGKKCSFFVLVAVWSTQKKSQPGVPPNMRGYSIGLAGPRRTTLDHHTNGKWELRKSCLTANVSSSYECTVSGTTIWGMPVSIRIMTWKQHVSIWTYIPT
ncbi:hypothetical protein CEXT_788991 [Caerostris extrusa]|uniref:Secreted protein n=1 Tax=Caerostris extrusa TaxID=172846 RepID=A0AAV4MT51_CAEEX|nr:hypothetical protein CEXT_788991 [Caerostris extrusa]